MEVFMENEAPIYATIDEQIEKLKKQGLIIDDIDFAKTELSLYGYSNLIKSYRDPYTIVSDGKKFYRSGITFEQIWSLYILDKNLRNAVMASMLDLEEHIKEAAADVIASKYGIDQNDYLQFRNFVNKKKRKERFSLPSILDTLKAALDTDKNPIAHYSEKYGVVPPWILFKSIYFSTIVNFINLFKPEEQSILASKLYDENALNIHGKDLIFLMLDTLFICIEYRNLAAHGGRIYNHVSKSRLRFASQTNNSIHGFSQLLFLLNMLNYQFPFEHLSDSLNYELSRHCSMYPEDITYLSQILNVNIIQRTPVWITSKSNKYHMDRHCCGIKDPIELDLSEAKKNALQPCKKCCHEII
ncbi:hypothetical protein GPK86_14255 [Blautia faecis]|nr:hypothetical protein [Blautia faecis]